MLPCKDTTREQEQICFMQRWKTGEGTFTWLGTSPSPTFLSCDPGLSLFGRRWLVSPAGAGTPSVENWVRSLVDVFERHCCLEPLFPL